MMQGRQNEPSPVGIGKNLGWLGFLLGGFDLDRVLGNDAFVD